MEWLNGCKKRLLLFLWPRRIEELRQSLAAQERLVEQLSQEKQQLVHLLEEPGSMDVQVRFSRVAWAPALRFLERHVVTDWYTTNRHTLTAYNTAYVYLVRFCVRKPDVAQLGLSLGSFKSEVQV